MALHSFMLELFFVRNCKCVSVKCQFRWIWLSTDGFRGLCFIFLFFSLFSVRHGASACMLVMTVNTPGTIMEFRLSDAYRRLFLSYQLVFMETACVRPTCTPRSSLWGVSLQGPLGEIVKRRVLIGQLALWLHFQKLWNNPEMYLFQSNIHPL